MIARNVWLAQAYSDRGNLSDTMWIPSVVTALAANLSLAVTSSIVFRPILRQLQPGWLSGNVTMEENDIKPHNKRGTAEETTFSLGSVVRTAPVEEVVRGSTATLHAAPQSWSQLTTQSSACALKTPASSGRSPSDGEILVQREAAVYLAK